MDLLEIFALVVLLVLLAALIAGWILLGLMPGKIARERNHPQAEAITICGWWGIFTVGLLLPVAWIWAYTNPGYTLKGKSKPVSISQKSEGEDP